MVRSNLQIQMQVFRNYEQDIWEHLKNNLENESTSNEFDYLMVEVYIIQRPVNFQGRSIDWLCVAGPSVMKKLWPFLNNCLFFSSYHIYYFVIVWKLFRVDLCWADVHFWYSLSGCNKGSIGETRAHAFYIFPLLGLNRFKRFRFWSYIKYCFYPRIKFC